MKHNRNNSHNTKPGNIIQPRIVKESDNRFSNVENLDNNLANEIELSQKTRTAHWNMSRESFFNRSALLDFQYSQLNDVSDEFTVQARLVDSLPANSFEEFLKKNRVDEQLKDISDTIWIF